MHIYSLLFLVSQQTKWKHHRQVILSWLEQFLMNTSQESSSCSSDEVVYHRCMALQKQLLSTILRASSSQSKRKILLLLDDNFYYQSMRYEVYQLARKCMWFSEPIFHINSQPYWECWIVYNHFFLVGLGGGRKCS